MANRTTRKRGPGGFWARMQHDAVSRTSEEWLEKVGVAALVGAVVTAAAWVAIAGMTRPDEPVVAWAETSYAQPAYADVGGGHDDGPVGVRGGPDVGGARVGGATGVSVPLGDADCSFAGRVKSASRRAFHFWSFEHEPERCVVARMPEGLGG